jgi:hypothetical protein
MDDMCHLTDERMLNRAVSKPTGKAAPPHRHPGLDPGSMNYPTVMLNAIQHP